MRKLILIHLIILGLLPGITAANPNFRGGHPPCMNGMPPFHAFNHDNLPPFLADIDLTASQKEQIHALLKSRGTEVQEKMQAMFQSKAELHQSAFSTDYSEEKLKALIANSAEIAGQALLAKARLDHDIFMLLNNEQQQKLQQRAAEIEAPGKP